MKKFIITEEEKKHIRGLYEQISQSDKYSAMLGYIDLYGDSMTKDSNIDTLKMIQAKKDVKIYCEDMRDGKPAKELSTPESKGLFKTVAKLAGEHSNPQELISRGKNIKTNRLV